MAPLLLAFSPTTISREAADWTTTQLASSPLLVRLPAGCSGETEKQDQESGWSGVEGSRTPSPKPTPQINILPTTVYQENPVPLFITGPDAGIPSSPSRTPIAHRRVTVRFSTCAFPSSPLPLPLLLHPLPHARCMDRAWARNYFYICASRSVYAR